MRSLKRFFASALVAGLVACGGGAPPEPAPPPSTDHEPGTIAGTLVLPGDVGGENAPSGNAPSQHAGSPGRTLEVVPGDLLVRVREGTLSRLSVAGIELTRVRSLAGSPLQLYRAAGLSATETVALAEALTARPDIERAFPNWILYSFKEPNDPLYPLQWHYPAMNLPAGWDLEDGVDSNVTVAVIDSGIIRHPDLQPSLLPGYDFVSDASVSGDGGGRDPDPTDEGGRSAYHGAHVAGTIAAASDNGSGVAGVSWGANIVPVRALGTTGSGSLLDILEGTLWAAGADIAGVPSNANPAQVINMSLGADIAEPCPADLDGIFSAIADEGIVVVVAAGNDGVDAATTFPAGCPSVITVGATGPRGTRASYSNYGNAIDVMAPGGDMTQTFTVEGQSFPAGVLSTILDDSGQPDYAFFQGTSMASPHVAGLVALMLARTPGLSVAAVRSRLQGAATPLSASDCDRPNGDDCGAGLVNAAVALGGSGATPPPPPPPTEALPSYVVGFYCLTPSCFTPDGGDLAFDMSRSRVIQVEASRNRVPYELSDLAAGRYLMAAWQDINRNSQVDDGEPFGFIATPILVQEGQTVRDVVIYLTPFASTRAGAPSHSVPLPRLHAAFERVLQTHQGREGDD